MTRPRTLTEEQLEKVYAWRRANKSYEFIARRVQISASAVRHQCLLACAFPEGVEPALSKSPMVVSRNGGQVRRFTDGEDQLILSMHRDRCGPTEIARALGRQSGSICNRLAALKARQQRSVTV